ncbi:hypothetical protein NPIL_238461 [Nephila pilipes]|uniref:Uncharacterized protein n=1 Tax=Nephila pilipes TaxID=299642 RepID=A0A8X6K586_NEPPI|nr:hypothetical protein NPIL_238461 [Nephila pilipes]
MYPCPAVIVRAKDLTDILDICKSLITDRITKSIVEETNKYICSVKTNYSRSRDARGRRMERGERMERDVLCLFYLSGVYHGNRVILEELWRRD